MRLGETEFTKTKFEGLDGKVVVSYVSGDSSQEIRATRQGLEVRGVRVTTEQELDQLAKMVSEAWGEHRRLKPKLVTSLSGH